MDGGKAIARHKDVNAFREPAYAVMEQRHAARNRVCDSQFTEAARNLPKRVLDGAAFLEVPTASAQGPPRIRVEARFVRRHTKPLAAACHDAPFPTPRRYTESRSTGSNPASRIAFC